MLKTGRTLGIERTLLTDFTYLTDLTEEIDLLDTMLTSLVELLEAKGILTQAEWEKRIKDRVGVG
jgi:hypothetical protein